jgi:glycosyltransferase involved in cell wall biosynthesis
MSDLPAISTVIPAYRAARTVGAALDSLLGQRYAGKLEIVVVRTGPDEGTDAEVRRRHGVRLVARDEREFAGAARNLGAQKAQGEIVAFMDADCRALPGWLLSIAKAAEHGIRAQAGAIETAPPKTLPACAEEFLETLEFHPRGRPRPLPFASAANSAYDAELFRAAGGFPDVKLGEDLMLGEALRQRGVPITFNPEMGVLHENAVALRRFLEKQREHGIYSARVRREAEGLRGSLFARQPLLLPLLGPARLFRLLTRSARISPALLPPLFALSPLVTLGVASWTWGFAKGVNTHGK